MGVQISCGVYPEVSASNALQGIAQAFRRGVSKACEPERGPDIGRTLDVGSCTHADLDTAEISSVPSDWLHQGQERDSFSEGLR